MAGVRALTRKPDVADGEAPLLTFFHRGWLPARPVGVGAIVFIYLAVVRTHGISETFWLAGDQVRDWTLALGSWRDLPMTGPPSTVGGTSLGPIYYWTLLVIRYVIGPWTHNLPHAGGIGLSIIQSAADIFLLLVIWRVIACGWFALAVVLFLATAPYDMALTATIWNPPLAVALVKAAIGLTLLAGDRPSIGWAAVIAASAWLAVQAHSSAMFVAAPLLAALPARDLLARRWVGAARSTGTMLAVILLLQVPFLLSLSGRRLADAGPTAVIGDVSSTLSHPGTLRILESLGALTRASEFLLMSPWNFRWLALVLAVAAVVVMFRARGSPTLLSVTVAPQAFAIVGFAFWQRSIDHYWYLTLMPSVALTLALAAGTWRSVSRAVATGLTIAVVASQPQRLEYARSLVRMPEYGAFARGSRQIRRYADEVRSIDTEFSLPDATDSTYLYKVLGGHVTASGRLRAIIGRSGQVTFRPEAP